jgi:hypothetical protein
MQSKTITGLLIALAGCGVADVPLRDFRIDAVGVDPEDASGETLLHTVIVIGATLLLECPLKLSLPSLADLAAGRAMRLGPGGAMIRTRNDSFINVSTGLP